MRSVKTVNRTSGAVTIASGLATGLKAGTGGRGIDSLDIIGNGLFLLNEPSATKFFENCKEGVRAYESFGRIKNPRHATWTFNFHRLGNNQHLPHADIVDIRNIVG